MGRKSLVNWLVPAEDMPMSLLAYSAWTSPNVWTRTIPCSATLSAAPSSLASKFLQNRFGAGPFHPDSMASLPLQCLLSPRMKAKNAGKKATPKEYLPHTRSIATDGPALVLWRLEAQPIKRAVQHGGPHTILRRSRAQRWCRVGAKNLALHFANSSLGPERDGLPLGSLWNELQS